MGETMMLGLRLLEEGVSASAFEARHGVALHDHFGAQIDELTGFGLLEWDGIQLRLTQRGHVARQ